MIVPMNVARMKCPTLTSDWFGIILFFSAELPPLKVNLAYKQDAWQADVYSNTYGPDLAVDGNFSPEWSANSCSMTNNMHHPWWAVDLGLSYKVDRVAMQNRDSNGESQGHHVIWTIRASMVTSSNGNISRVTGPLCGEFTGHR